MVSEDLLISCFSNLDCDISDKSVVDKCVQICNTYNLDEELFVELWVAYSIPNSLTIVPTINDLNKFEKEELSKNNENHTETAEQAISNIQISAKVENEFIDNVLDIYNTGESSTLKQTKRARSLTPEAENDNKLQAVDHKFIPSTYTPKSDTPSRAPSTTVRGRILLNFGPIVKNWEAQNGKEVSIVKADIPHVPKDAVYMYEMLSKQGAIFAGRCRSFGERLCYLWNSRDSKESKNPMRYVRNVAVKSQTPFRTFGRIRITTDNTSDKKDISLEGYKKTIELMGAPTVNLDLSGIKHHSVFPGQIVAVECNSSNGQDLIVKQLFVSGYAPLFDAPKLSQDIKIYVAAGPFTLFNDLNFQPLWNLMERVAEDEPNVLILVGPFVDETHSEIKKFTLKDTYQDLFDKILAKILQYLHGKSTRIVLVPSNHDVHHDAVFPTPEFEINHNKIGLNTANVYSMPDPCIINIEGLHVGITSVDVFRHLGKLESSNTPAMDRFARLADHLLSQATFYPLYPAFTGFNLDITLWNKYACFEKQPHIMILPSDVRHYCKTVNECLILNPERLEKYNYAKLCIHSSRSEKWDPNNVSCEIAKL